MANRVMKAKAIKLRAQQRRYPRRLELDRRGPRPSIEVIREYKQRASTLGYDEANAWWVGLNGELTNKPITNTPPGVYDINCRTPEILRRFDNPLFVEYMENAVMRVRIYFNSRQDECIIQQMVFGQRIYRLSDTFASIDDCYFALKQNIVPWKIEKPFPEKTDA